MKLGKDKKAVVLLSGGLDSSTVVAYAKSERYEVYALSFSYGQRHNIELEYAKKQAQIQKVREHKIANIDLRAFGGSALTADIDVPKNRDEKQMSAEIPITYVPARNTIFLSYALAYAEVLGANDIFIGVNALDYSGYPDCRPEYIKTFERLANLATKVGVEEGLIKIHTPLINMTKAEIIKLGLSLGVDYNETISCYDPQNGVACGVCDSCKLREKGFKEMAGRGYDKAQTPRPQHSTCDYNIFSSGMQEGIGFDALVNGVSGNRLKSYLLMAKNDKNLATKLYVKNLQICGVFYHNLHWVEISIRNSINKELSKDYGDKWFDNDKLGFGEIELEKIKGVKELIKKEGKLIDNSGIISNLSFGFWVNLFNGRYENLWRYSLRKVFSYNNKILKRGDISFRLHSILKLRNRVAHYEPIINYDLNKYNLQINELLSWIEPEFLFQLKNYDQTIFNISTAI